MGEPVNGGWTGSARVRARRDGEAIELRLGEVTSQARVYKQLLRDFLRRDFPVRPRWGDFCVEIRLSLRKELPAIDLDNVAKAVLDGVKGAIFFDDAQVMRLLVEKHWAEAEEVMIRAAPHDPVKPSPPG
jgi:crossover junction endodeoxyribonuclease RusA